MNQPVKNIDYEEIRKILQKNDHRIIFQKTNMIPDESDLFEELKEYINLREIGRKSVLGLDIYRYSLYGEFEQTLIPFLFKRFFQTATELCLRNHRFLFQHYTAEDFKNNFISTGDGGFMIFDTPVHSLVFAVNMAIILRTYNAFHFYPKLRKIIGGMSLRYAITYDKVYSFDDNFYGRAIINNARILMKDDLNRCLIDQNVHTWFTVNIEGLENLQILTINDIANIYDFQRDYDTQFLEEEDQIFLKDQTRKKGIINSDILKIGKINLKDTELSIYNLHLQVSLKLSNDDDPNQEKIVTVSLGNLNTSGI